MGGLASLSHVRTASFPSITLSLGLMDTRSLLGASVRRSDIRTQVASYLPFSALRSRPSYSHSTGSSQALDVLCPMELLATQL